MKGFDDLIERLSKFPRSQRLVAYSSVAIVVLLVYFLVFLSPAQTEAEEYKLKTEAFKSDYDARITLEKQEKRLISDITLLKERQAFYAKALPDRTKGNGKDMDIPDLLKDISEKGRKSGLEIKKFEPGEEADVPNNNYVKQLPIVMSVEGGFHEVAIFFDKLSSMERIVHVKNITIQIEKETPSDVSLTVEGKVVTFRFLNDDEKSEIAEKQAQEAKRKKRKKKKGKKK
jgi:type IV pilus assembly protein PilO